jgi:predicted nucleic acid-binding protein
MRLPLILDTGGWLLALAGDEPYAAALEDAAPAYVPGLVLAEVDYHLRKRRKDMGRLLEEIRQGHYTYEAPSLSDLKRASEFDKKFTSVGLGLVDATVAALAERLTIHRILTTDSDFYAIRIGPRWNKALELVVPPPSGRRA